MMKKMLAATALASALMFSAVASANVVVYENVDIVNKFKFQTNSFSIATGGTYQATLSDFSFLDAFSKMGLAITSSTQLMGKITGPGSFTFNASPGTYYASFAGIAGNPSKVSTYGVNVAMVPEAGTWAMMIAGVGLVGWSVRRNRKSEKNQAVAA